MRIIAVEEHFYTEEYYHFLLSRKDQSNMRPPAQAILIKETGEARLKDMDSNGITMQVLSLSLPVPEDFDLADDVEWSRKTNDGLGVLAKKYPDRFTGYAALPLHDPIIAAQELERAVKQIGLKGAKVHSHFQQDYFDDKKYWVIFEKAQALNVPIYLHPREPSLDMIKPYLAYPGLSGALAGYGAETYLHTLRLILSGLFDEYPRLKIILGHMGEALPFWQWRIDNMAARRNNPRKLQKKVSDYLKDNFYFSTSGMFSIPAFMCNYLTFGADHMLFAVDYPHEMNAPAIKFMKDVPICDADKEKIYHLNAEKLLSL